MAMIYNPDDPSCNSIGRLSLWLRARHYCTCSCVMSDANNERARERASVAYCAKGYLIFSLRLVKRKYMYAHARTHTRTHTDFSTDLLLPLLFRSSRWRKRDRFARSKRKNDRQITPRSACKANVKRKRINVRERTRTRARRYFETSVALVAFQI